MRTDKLKILIVGGGPAGLLTAILLARKGHLITLVDKKIWPIDKVCGEGIMPVGLEILDKYGILEKISPKFSRDFKGIRYINSDNTQAYGEFLKRPGKAVRRIELSRVLYEEALKENLIDLKSGHEIHSIDENDEFINAKIKETSSATISTDSKFDYIIGADGIKSKVKKLCNRHGKNPGVIPKRMGARFHIDMEPWDDKVRVYWGDSIECYVAPTSDYCVEFNFGWDHEKIWPQKNGGLENGLFSYFPELKSRIEGKKRLSTMKSLGPLPNRADIPLKKRVALIGDASIFYDQITGEGLTLAFMQAELVGQTIEEWGTKDGQDHFNKKVGQIADHYIGVTSLALFLTNHLFFRKIAIWFLSRSPKLFSYILHTNMGEHDLFPPPIKLIFKALFKK